MEKRINLSTSELCSEASDIPKNVPFAFAINNRNIIALRPLYCAHSLSLGCTGKNYFSALEHLWDAKGRMRGFLCWGGSTGSLDAKMDSTGAFFTSYTMQ
jgi:hypothetical protein